MDNSERLLREAVEEKRRELEELESIALFTPRRSLARTPPGGFGSVEELRGAEKRPLQSPEELQEALRRKLEPSTSGSNEGSSRAMKECNTEELIEFANMTGSEIMAAATGNSSKLNKADIGLISTQVQRLTAVVATLAGRLAKAKECAHTTTREPDRSETKSYASTLRTGRTTTQPKPQGMGSVLAVYLADNSGVKTAEETKAVLKEAIKPTSMGLQVARLRKVRNAGLVLQTRTKEDAENIKNAMPSTLRVQDAGQRTPLVAVINVEGHIKDEKEILGALRKQYFADVPEKEGFPKVAFYKKSKGGSCTTVVLACSGTWRDRLMSRERVYLEWERYLVRDFLEVTCCTKCQWYGYSAKHCKAVEETCSKCGTAGHGHKINLQGALTATAELPGIAQRLGLGIVLVQEQYARAQLPGLLQCTEDSKAGIYVNSTKISGMILPQLSTSHCLVAYFRGDGGDLYMVSAYFQYCENIETHIHHLDRVLEALQGKPIVIGADTNTHSPLWHSRREQYEGRGAEVNRRRLAMESFIHSKGLLEHNKEGEPFTFNMINGSSNIDVTITTRGVPVRQWRVRQEVSSSDHQLITPRAYTEPEEDGEDIRKEFPSSEGKPQIAGESSSSPSKELLYKDTGIDKYLNK
ncbi:unnamed protein product [Leptidea sinapis]|uniref:Endonuclease/exonuclease/phosphatase domain-containing protein n=1 Tax=Leptidea sinapis TaxID=189913 RepID=A0A5E4PMN5_9NEOP|nr:unnamed protein product [Leptidea sinapis]